MRLRVLVPIAVIAVALLLPSFGSGAAGEFDRWTGTWTVGAKNRAGKFYAFGNMHLRLAADDTTVTGSYAFSGGGTVNGELNRRLGREFCGSYKQPDTDGDGFVKGRFCFEIAKGDPDTFTGESWQTKPRCGVLGCPQHYREGHKA
jgi:hypothetical protein